MRFTIRLSIRKLTLYSLAVTSCILLALNIHQRTLGLFTSNLPYHASGLRRIRLDRESVIHTTVPPNSSLLEPSDNRLLVVPEPQQRPWYMEGGSVRPPPYKEGVAVFPDQAEGSDRILNQLMHLPPPGAYPANQDSSTAPLKLILLWNGIGSWGGIRQGRGVFLKEKCPVSTCAISSSRLDAQKADLVLFKDHFTMPSFSRYVSLFPKNNSSATAQSQQGYMFTCLKQE